MDKGIFPFSQKFRTSIGQIYTLNFVDVTRKCENRRTSVNTLLFSQIWKLQYFKAFLPNFETKLLMSCTSLTSRWFLRKFLWRSQISLLEKSEREKKEEEFIKSYPLPKRFEKKKLSNPRRKEARLHIKCDTSNCWVWFSGLPNHSKSSTNCRSVS